MRRDLLPSILRGAAGSDLPTAEVFATISAPALVLAWSGDPAHPVSTAERLAALLHGARLHVADDLAGIRSWTGLIDTFLHT